MAVTSIWPIKGRVDRVINYARNPEKTTEVGLQERASLHAVDNVVEYAANDMKTERRSYVSCLNCREDTASAQFMETKRLWGKLGGRVCYHGYGFGSHVDWCACFVSWCANECGYINAGVIPKFSGCVNGTRWFKDQGLWQDNSYVPRSGDIIFFDWNNKGGSGPQDGLADHVGIVEKVENGIIYTVEGNSGDSCPMSTT